MAYSETISQAIAEGAKLYAIKQYDEAATKYADACASYNEEHGEDDADLLLLYGKALFQSAVTRSGMLGGIGDNEEEQEEKEEEENDDGNFHFEDGIAPEVDDDENAEPEKEQDNEENEENQEAPQEQEEEAGPEQSDFEVAWEILELTRSLLDNKLKEESAEGLESPYLKDADETPSSSYVATIKKLSEVYDLLGEVSLEAENFAQAATDLQSCLELRQKLYSADNGLVSECHYKLSLALEFSLADDSRAKATEQMKYAIESVKLRNTKETDEEKKKDNDSLLRDMEERYKELKKSPKADLQAQQMDIIKGIMGEAVSGEGSSAAKAVQDLSNMVKKKPAVNDLSSMVKKRKAKPDESESKKPKK
ncbi:uncharacterized protein CXQ87_000183 [Candidozyma duobushaemuli]|uniref:Tetratricopeptide SHNi-TPR domain-containing protein n=2 Tax=Candidozyma TaxID=3303203 RepID=A0ABX8I464_9ASCO|nr:uncharacterized protein CXQ87_000183 [[Candida] duobushaemulonis]PVH17299.1 hypothetical protein CXQ87_000183 [[Candida] duobushaemulonis]QWU85948.1 hypothetical protein CA3LBN_000166 [[Candida] haemuloni]